ncbi:MAG: tetratricopeptide repeat protein [Gemmatimonadetes bacterium]|nr:tetratricopeptide repeat protein [Gemmatimonadota bacterium]
MNAPPRGRGGVSPLAAVVIALLAIGIFANTLGHGFAYDDRGVVVDNPTVTDGDPMAALSAPWWSAEAGGGRLYRPATQAALATQWRVFDGSPAGFHVVNVGLHVLVSLLVAVLIATLLGHLSSHVDARRTTWAVLAGATVFAVHPVHVEAVANVVGQAELWSAVGVLTGALLHVRTRDGDAVTRVIGTLGLAACVALAFGAKESGVTLLLLLVLLEVGRARGVGGWLGVARREAPRMVLVAGVVGFLLFVRWAVLGGLAGEDVTTVLAGLSAPARWLTVLPVWTEYLRLLVWPVTLSVDYDPGVLFPATGPAPVRVLLGGIVLAGAIAIATLGWRRNRTVALGVAWFLVTILPVSNLLVPTGSLLAERTLYLPSVGLALVVAGLVAEIPVERWVPTGGSRALVGGLAVVLVLLSARTWTRNPVWESSATVMRDLVEHHPESWRAQLARAQGLAATGDHDGAAEAYRAGLAALPGRYSMVLAAGIYFKERGRYEEARPLLEQAVDLGPDRASSWRHLAELELLEGRFREAHRVAATGIGAAPPTGPLWAVLAEAYAGGGLLEAAVRAKRVSLRLGPAAQRDWARLADFMEASGADPQVVADVRRGVDAGAY